MSGITRFISDPHFFHNNMAVYRGFPDSYNHDENIIAQWNSVVNKRDITWILGDITMHKNNYEILDRLLGIKRVVLGNHDEGNHVKFLLNHVNSVHGLIKINDKKHGNIFLSHCPIHPIEFNYRVDYNIHGHMHENSIDDSRYINVCVEAQEYLPKTLDQLLNK